VRCGKLLLEKACRSAAEWAGGRIECWREEGRTLTTLHDSTVTSDHAVCRRGGGRE